MTEALAGGELDVSFMPVDEVRRASVDFGPTYYIVESTYLVAAPDGPRDIAGVDRPSFRVLSVRGTTTIRAAARTLSSTQPVAVTSVREAITALRVGRADAFALSRDSLGSLLAELPGSHVVSGAFQKTPIAVAVSKGRPDFLRQVSTWLRDAKDRGLVRRAFDELGFANEAIPPLDA